MAIDNLVFFHQRVYPNKNPLISLTPSMKSVSSLTDQQTVFFPSPAQGNVLPSVFVRNRFCQSVLIVPHVQKNAKA